jgi:hypothetical protein
MCVGLALGMRAQVAWAGECRGGRQSVSVQGVSVQGVSVQGVSVQGFAGLKGRDSLTPVGVEEPFEH